MLDNNSVIFTTLVFRDRSRKVTNVFQVVYIAFYKALIVHNLEIANYKSLCGSLENSL